MRRLSDLEFNLEGMVELQESLRKAIKKYPDKAQERLEDVGKKFKRRVIQITRSAVDQHSGRLIKGYKLDKVRNYGVNMEKDFRGTAPHFHLIENGHIQITKNGKVIGFVPGRLIVKQARDEFADKMPDTIKELIDDITRECDL